MPAPWPFRSAPFAARQHAARAATIAGLLKGLPPRGVHVQEAAPSLLPGDRVRIGRYIVTIESVVPVYGSLILLSWGNGIEDRQIVSADAVLDVAR